MNHGIPMLGGMLDVLAPVSVSHVTGLSLAAVHRDNEQIHMGLGPRVDFVLGKKPLTEFLFRFTLRAAEFGQPYLAPHDLPAKDDVMRELAFYLACIAIELRRKDLRLFLRATAPARRSLSSGAAT